VNLRPPAGEDLRLRPRDGEPRCLIEFVAQWLWRWRIELFLIYIVVMVTVGVYHEMTT
jgi:choline kinase